MPPWSPQAVIYSHSVDLEWMQKKLKEYYRLVERGTEEIDQHFERADVLRLEPTVREILKRLDPTLADRVDIYENWGRTVDAVDDGLGILAAREACETKLVPGIPVLLADHFHPWVWRAARTLWDSAHYRHAVQAAATAISDHTQTKLDRRDVADTQLMQEAFSPNPPEPGKPRLRYPGDPANPITQSRQRGALQYAAGCFGAIRNPATHEQDEWDQEAALEYLAALSILARWIDDWALHKAP